jgi:hypothetical protein
MDEIRIQNLQAAIRRDDLVRCKKTGQLMLVIHATATLAHCAWNESFQSRAGIFPREQLEVGRQPQESEDVL